MLQIKQKYQVQEFQMSCNVVLAGQYCFQTQQQLMKKTLFHVMASQKRPTNSTRVRTAHTGWTELFPYTAEHSAGPTLHVLVCQNCSQHGTIRRGNRYAQAGRVNSCFMEIEDWEGRPCRNYILL